MSDSDDEASKADRLSKLRALHAESRAFDQSYCRWLMVGNAAALLFFYQAALAGKIEIDESTAWLAWILIWGLGFALAAAGQDATFNLRQARILRSELSGEPAPKSGTHFLWAHTILKTMSGLCFLVGVSSPLVGGVTLTIAPQ